MMRIERVLTNVVLLLVLFIEKAHTTPLHAHTHTPNKKKKRKKKKEEAQVREASLALMNTP